MQQLYQDISNVLVGTIKKNINVKKIKNKLLLKTYFKIIYWVNVLGLIFRLIKYVTFKFYVDKHKKSINSYIYK